METTTIADAAAPELSYPERIIRMLTDARDLLKQDGVWIQGDFARTPDGRPARPDTPGAVQFCTVGALHRVSANGLGYWGSDPIETVAYEYLDEVMDGPSDQLLSYWNDHPRRKVGSVIRLYNRAIRKVKQDCQDGVIC